MILGLGTDIVEVDRISRMLADHGSHFLERIYSPEEIAHCMPRREPAPHLAGRWAAKEACSKALGTGLRMGIAWKDMAVSNLWTGQPVMALTGWAAERLAKMTPPGHRAVFHVTLTDDHPWAQAFVVIEALPLETAPPPGELTPENPGVA